MIKLEGVTCKRGANVVLREINLQLGQGDICGVIGKSGVGKTTLLKLIAGLLDPKEGEITFEGKKVVGPSLKLVPGYDDIQLVNQDFGLEPYHTVEENVREKIISRHSADQKELIEEYLELVELSEMRERKAIDLSGGEKQRLSIARALACEPKVLLLDEPFVHLDQRLRWKVMNYLSELNAARDTTIILVSHDGAEMIGFVKKIVVLEEGALVRKDDSSAVYYTPRTIEEAQLLGEINCIKTNGEEVMFRPNEFEIGGDLKVCFEHFVDTGIVIQNYFKTAKGESVLLYSLEPMNEVQQISIVKK